MDANSCRFVIDRPTHTELDLLKELGMTDNESDTSSIQKKMKSRLRSNFQCSKDRMMSSVVQLFPIFGWLRYYKKKWLPGDIIAGLTVGIVHVPQSLAFTILAGLAPVFGLYTTFYSVLIYSFMGTSRQLSIGTFAITSLLTRSVVQKYVPDEYVSSNTTYVYDGTTNTTTISPVNESSISELDIKRASVAAALALVAGLFQILFGIFRLGFIKSYLSESVIKGFTMGCAFHVITSQAPAVFGVKIHPYNGIFSFIYKWVDIFKSLPETNIPTLILSIVCMIFLITGREINARCKSKMKIPIPTEVILVVITILVSYFVGFSQRYDINVVDYIPLGLPAPRIPETSILPWIIGDGFSVAFVGFTINLSIAKMYGMQHRYPIDANQELIAYGATNLIPAFFLCYPNSAALARCEIQNNSGGQTQLAGIIASVLVLLVVLAIGPIFEPLPMTVLACIIIVGLFGILARFRLLKTLFQQSKIEFFIWILTWIAVLVLGVDVGLLAGAALAGVIALIRTQWPSFEILTNVPETEIYRSSKNSNHSKKNLIDSNEHILIVKLHSSLYYINRDLFRKKLVSTLGFDPVEVRVSEDSEIVENDRKTRVLEFVGFRMASQEAPEIIETPVHSVIVDCGSFGFIDLGGVNLLKQLWQEFNKIGISFYLANCSRDVRKSLSDGGYFDISGEKADFVSIHDATIYINHKSGETLHTQNTDIPQ